MNKLVRIPVSVRAADERAARALRDKRLEALRYMASLPGAVRWDGVRADVAYLEALADAEFADAGMSRGR